MIFVVEDEASIRELIVYTLRGTDFEARGFAEAGAFWAAMRETLPSLVLLDIMLPGEDGLSVLRRLRAQAATRQLPVMLLTAKGSEYDKVLGLDLGADDYLAKPVGMMELAARVRSLLRRSADAFQDTFALGGLALSVPRHAVTADGAAVALTPKEFDLLAVLLKNAGLVLTRERILAVVWGYAYEGETRTVDTHILTLRGKLGACGALIQTVRGVGYKAGVV